MKTLLISSCIVASCLSITGCQSPSAKMQSLCDKIETLSTQTDDCHSMAQKLSKETPTFKKFIDEATSTDALSEGEFKLYTDALSVCTRAFLEISAGPCGEVEDIKAALP